ncbi:metallophosphoesterase family protein [Magnetovibrio sp. PR-2]|uniref:metallophosphoesterase family protein n=1 Tax=Magnetovibrio sp. PR-2 TaxID=3120356 RepID=UPI002FCE2B62
MKTEKRPPPVLDYHGASRLNVRLPREGRDWTHGGPKSIAKDGDNLNILVQTLSQVNEQKLWSWPKRQHFFFSDLHGDPDAFVASLVASGGVKKTGKKHNDFSLTQSGRKATFVIGGDCFDKGPSSLELLRTIKGLIDTGARVRLLAGNHDVRVKLGLSTVGQKRDDHNEHFFIRTGQKIIPLIKEVWGVYLKDGKGLKGVPHKKECRRRLYPSVDWFDHFPDIAQDSVRPAQIKRELGRIHKKQDRFEAQCKEVGLNLRHVYAAAMKWQDLFLQPDGEFAWFYKKLRLSYRAGSFLFVHAGLDNVIAKRLRNEGVKVLNQEFREALYGKPFDFYYGSLCNTIRTKYRNVDQPFSQKGARHVRQAGISAVVHGHRNLHYGQRLAGCKNLLSFECDASVDRQTRSKERVRGRGAAVTIIEPQGRVLGVSSDYPYVKVFEPEATLKALKKDKSKLRRKS